MSGTDIIVLGGPGLIGSALCERLERDGLSVLSVSSKNYQTCAGARADVLINCNGNSFRYKAAENPRWDFDASVLSVERSLFDYQAARYVYVSTIDVYNEVSDRAQTHEDASIDPARLHPYAFHKWLAERLVERFAKDPLILRTGTVIGPAMKKGPLFDVMRGEPLHMSAQSELSFIDTGTIAEVVAAFVAKMPPQRIVNLTGTGPARLETLCAELGLECRVAPGAENVLYRYDIDNTALRRLFPITTSYEIAARFMGHTLKS